MKTGLKTFLVAGIGIAALQFAARAEEKPALTNKTDRISYTLGMNIGLNLKRAGFEVDLKVLSEAIGDALAGREMKLTEAEAQKIYGEYQNEMRVKRDEARVKLAEKNRKEGDEFLAQNAKKPGVKTHKVSLPDGKSADFQYKVATEGTGDSPDPSYLASVNLRGTLINGTEFDNSAKRGGPIKVTVGRAFVRGLSEALPMMKVGSKWTVYVPSSLAFGDVPGPPGVEPGSTVIFEVELLSAEPPPVDTSTRPMTSDVVKVPSREELDKGAKIEVIKAEEAERMARTNTPAPPKKP